MKDASQSLQNQAYKLITSKILRTEYRPGQKISQPKLTEELQLGLTPVREALLRLKREGLVYSVPQSGTFVSKINLDTVVNARFIRETLEQKVVAEAAKSPHKFLISQAQDAIALQESYASEGNAIKFFEADESFHKTFYLMTDHAQVWNWLQNVEIQFNRFRWLRLAVSDLPWRLLIEQHKEILAAVEAEKPKQSEKIAGKHLQLMLKEVMTVTSAFPDYFENLPE